MNRLCKENTTQILLLVSSERKDIVKMKQDKLLQKEIIQIIEKNSCKWRMITKVNISIEDLENNVERNPENRAEN